MMTTNISTDISNSELLVADDWCIMTNFSNTLVGTGYMQSWASSDNWWLVICMKNPRAAKYKRNILHPMIDDNAHHRAFLMANFCHWQYLFGRKFWTNLFFFSSQYIISTKLLFFWKKVPIFFTSKIWKNKNKNLNYIGTHIVQLMKFHTKEHLHPHSLFGPLPMFTTSDIEC